MLNRLDMKQLVAEMVKEEKAAVRMEGLIIILLYGIHVHHI